MNNDQRRDLVISLVQDIMVADPVDFSNVPHVDQDTASAMVVLNMMEFYDDLKKTSDNQEIFDAAVVAMLSKLSLENFVLFTERLQKGLF